MTPQAASIARMLACHRNVGVTPQRLLQSKRHKIMRADLVEGKFNKQQ
jgi:hypothetical protein